MSMLPSNVSGTAVLGSALLSRNSRVIIATIGRMTRAKTNSASITRWLLTASRDSATSAKPVASAGVGTNDAFVRTLEGRRACLIKRQHGHFSPPVNRAGVREGRTLFPLPSVTKLTLPGEIFSRYNGRIVRLRLEREPVSINARYGGG